MDADDGLQPSDLTPEVANVRVMVVRANRVRLGLYRLFPSSNIFVFCGWLSDVFFLLLQTKPILVATIAMPPPEIFPQDVY